MVSTLDLFPTLLAAAGAQPDADTPRSLDGVDLLPFLTSDGKKGAPHESLFWRSGAERRGAPGPLQAGLRRRLARLYDLERDPKEASDLSAKMPERVAAMREAWDAWNAQLSTARASARTEETTVNGDVFRWRI